MKIRALLREKSRTVQTIAANSNVEAAIELMAATRAGALIVTDNDQPVGIFTKRDVLHCVLKNKHADFSTTNLLSAMTPKLITAKPEDDIEQIIPVMLKAGVSHLPVMENENILRMLQLVDLFEYRIESLTDEINQLKDYIDDLHEAGRD